MKLTDKWFNALAEGTDKCNVFVQVRIDINNHRFSLKYPIRVDIHWDYESSNDRLPLEEEAAFIEEWGEAVKKAMEKDKLAINVIQAVGDGEKLWSYYTRNIEAFQKTLNASTKDLPTAPVTFYAERDEDWEAYDEALTLESMALEHDNE